jgi:cellobiose-specific phosphotransferase system component IIA
MWNSLYTILSCPISQILIGVFITWLWAKHYYQKATNDLKKEAAELRRLIDLIIQQIERMEKSNLLKVIRDESGKPIGLEVLMVHAQDSVSIAESTSPKVTVSSENKKLD